jgi:hypothetical protein
MQEMLATSSCSYAVGMVVVLQVSVSWKRYPRCGSSQGSAVTAGRNVRPIRGGGRAQVGEFYEAQGTDAVVLVQWASLNPMGRKPPPRAGAPVVNLRRTLDDILQNSGLSIVRSRLPCSWCRVGHGC